MKLLKSEIKGIKFYHRDGMSDLKTFNEVIGNEVYFKKGMTIQSGETWMDCGGNVGAFTLLACSKGAKVTVYEPDPFNCEMIKKNLKLNGFNADVKQYALVHDNTKELTKVVKGFETMQGIVVNVFEEVNDLSKDVADLSENVTKINKNVNHIADRLDKVDFKTLDHDHVLSDLVSRQA